MILTASVIRELLMWLAFVFAIPLAADQMSDEEIMQAFNTIIDAAQAASGEMQNGND